MRDLIERLEERVTGVTRMQLDKELHKLLKIGKSPRQAVLEIEKMYKLKDVRLNSKGDTVVYFEDINDAISEEKVEPPPGFIGRKVKSKISKVSYSRSNSDGGLSFHISGKVYDAYLKDQIGSVDPGLEKSIEYLRKAKYTDEEMQKIFDDARDADSWSGISLPRPVTISFTVFDRK